MMPRNRKNEHDNFLQDWYQFAATQPGFVGGLLTLLRERQRTSIRAQRNAFGASKENFARLLGMPLPRPNQYVADAKRIAGVCQLAHPDEFVKALLLGRSIRRADEKATTTRATNEDRSLSGLLHQPYYQAAMDADVTLDDLPGDEEE